MDPKYPALRVAQLDVEDLENSIENAIIEQHTKFLQSASVIDTSRFEPEALAMYRTLFWRSGVMTDGSTLGQRMMGVLYENFRATPSPTRAVHYVLTVLLPYFRSRLQNVISFLFNDQCLADTLERRLFYHLDTFLQALEFLNHIRFLNCGDYSNLIERCLKLHVVYKNRPSLGAFDYSTMNRELLWNVFADVITFLLPLLKFRWVVRKIWKKFHSSQNKPESSLTEETPKRSISQGSSSFTKKLKKSDEQNERGSVSLHTKCAFCRHTPTVPCGMGCDHFFCYYCLAAHMDEDENFCCPECNYSACGSSIQPIILKKHH